MKDILKDFPISPMTANRPLHLKTDDAVLEHRRQLFSPTVNDNCLHQTLAYLML